MIINKIIGIIISITALVVIPFQLVTTFILGIILSLPLLSLLLIPLSLIWVVFFWAPLLALSYLYEKGGFLKPIIGLVGVPFAVIGDTFTALIPSMGEIENRFEKMIFCQTFPYTWRYTQHTKNKLEIDEGNILRKILENVCKGNKPFEEYLRDRRALLYTLPYFPQKNEEGNA